MKVHCVSCLAAFAAVQLIHAYDWSSPALNETQHNLLPNPGGQVLYYNGSGDVPAYQVTSPDPIAITPSESSSVSWDSYYQQVIQIANGNSSDNCTQCMSASAVLTKAANTQSVQNFTELLIKICESETAVSKSLYAVNCRSEYASTPNATYPYSSGAAGLGAYYAQLFSKMGASGEDYQLFCYYTYSVCSIPRTIGIVEDDYFEPKSEWANWGLAPSGENLNVLHVSDYHLDSRYDIGSEANCTTHLCCRPDAKNKDLGTTAQNASLPASRFGSLICDAPPDLAVSAFDSMPMFFNMSSLDFAIFTGDIVSHDNDDQLSQAYVSYEEEAFYRTIKSALGTVPLYPTLGNHDSFPEAFNTQNSLNSNPNAMGWNYELLSSMWENNSWISSSEAEYASTHYGALLHASLTTAGQTLQTRPRCG